MIVLALRVALQQKAQFPPPVCAVAVPTVAEEGESGGIFSSENGSRVQISLEKELTGVGEI